MHDISVTVTMPGEDNISVSRIPIGGGIDGQNLGSNSGVYSHRDANTLKFRTLGAGNSIAITGDANDLFISYVGATGGGAGEVNTASNLGNGSGLFYQKSVADLQFKSLKTDANLRITGDNSQLTFSFVGDYATNTNLTATGATLYNYISAVSGNLITTGVNLQGQLSTLQNNTGNYVQNAANIGSFSGLYSGKIGTDLQFKSFGVGNNLSLTGNANQLKLEITTDFATNSNLTATGASLYSLATNQITGLSISGSESIIGLFDVWGDGTVYVTRSGERSIHISGSAGGGGEVNTASNLGVGSGLYATKVGADLQFKSISVGDNLRITGSTTQLYLNITGDYAFNSQLTATGANLQSQINTLTTNLATTGTNLWAFTSGVSGNLIVTGANLQGQINTTNTNVTNLAANLTTTGSNLWAFISGVSGNLIATGVNLQSQLVTLQANTGNYVQNGTNLTNGTGIFTSKNGTNLQFRTISGAGGVSIANDSDLLIISGSNAGGGEVNTASNLGPYSGLYSTKVSSDLQFKSLGVGNNLSITGNSTQLKIEITADYALNSNLTATGANLQGQINTLTTNLATTGSSLWAFVSGVSGNLTTTGANLQAQINTLTTNLTATGAYISDNTGSFVQYGSNLTNGTGIFKSKVGATLGFKTISGAGTVSINELQTDLLVISGSAAGGAGEVNTASNLGAGSGWYQQKVGTDLQFKSFMVGSNLGLTGDANNLKLEITTNYATATNLAITGANIISYVNTGFLPITGENFVTGRTTFKNYVVMENTEGQAFSSSSQAIELFNKNVARNQILYTKGNFGQGYGLGPAMWDKYIGAIFPGASSSLTTFGCISATSLGTVSHVASPYYGYYTNFAAAATPNAQAGESFSTVIAQVGNRTGENGFFFATKFILSDATGAYISGGIGESGFRLFAGLTDQASLAAVLSSNNAAGNRVGFSMIRASGGSTAGRDDVDFKVVVKNGTTELVFPTNMGFGSGLYEGFIYAPKFPDTGNVFWLLQRQNIDIVSYSGVSGQTTGIIPTPNTAMRAVVGLHSISGAAKNIGTKVVYLEI